MTGVPEGRMVAAGDHEMFLIERGEGYPTVFLHGGGPGGSGWTDFGPVVPYLSDRRMLLFDLLQWGQSSKPDGVGPLWTFHSEHVAMALDTLGIEQADFVCNSVGGSVALAFAASFPDRVRRLVVTGSQPTMEDPWEGTGTKKGRNIGALAYAEYYGGEGPTWDKARKVMAELEWYDPTGIPDDTVAIRLAQSQDPELLAWGVNARVRRGEPQDLTAELGKVAAEVLFLWAKYDPFVSVAYAQRLAGLVQHGDIYVMDQTSHHLEEERPHEYSLVVKSFLDRP